MSFTPQELTTAEGKLPNQLSIQNLKITNLRKINF